MQATCPFPPQQPAISPSWREIKGKSMWHGVETEMSGSFTPSLQPRGSQPRIQDQLWMAVLGTVLLTGPSSQVQLHGSCCKLYIPVDGGRGRVQQGWLRGGSQCRLLKGSSFCPHTVRKLQGGGKVTSKRAKLLCLPI